LVTGAMQSIWSLTSWSRPMSLPMLARGTWPEMIRTGEEAEYAVERPDMALRRPGPGTTSAVPNEPPARAYPSAMKLVACSWRVVMNRIRGSSRRAAITP
jgi:hypothetical protein